MGKAKILIVDDDMDFCISTSKILENKDYDVVTAYDGKEAFQKLKKERPDLIILDIMLPDQDGFSLCAELKEKTNFFEIPILILTAINGNSDSGDEKYSQRIALHHHADDFAEKPIDPDELLAKIYLLLNQRKVSVSEGTKKNKVLIIDADREFTRRIRQMLEANGFEVQVADTAKGGSRLVNAMSPNVIVMEAELSDKDGFTLSSEIKTDPKTYNIPIIMLTELDKQFAQPSYIRTIAAKHKVDDFISKPIEPEQLMEKIEWMIRTKYFGNMDNRIQIVEEDDEYIT